MVSYRIRVLILVLLVVVVALSEKAQAGENTVALTLKQAIRLAVEKNLEVRAELYNPAMSEADIRINRGIYDPLLTFTTNYRQSVTQSASTVVSGGALISRQKSLQADAGINQLLPIGGSLGLSYTNLWNRSNADPNRGFLDDYWSSELVASYAQPLLRNFGRDATEIGIAVAVNNKTASLDRFKNTLMDVVSRVRAAYFILYSLKENLAARNSALALAQKILADTKGQVRAGVLPAMEILNAEFGVATREKELIDAEKLFMDQMDVVRILLQMEGNQALNPVDPPTREKHSLIEDEAIAKALSQRPDLQAQRVNLQTLDLQTRVAHNRTLPDLTFNASAALTGLERDFGRDMKKLGSAEYPVWAVGLQFSYPLGNRTAKNEFIRSRLSSEQAQLQLKSLEETVRNEVRSAIRGVEASYRQLDVADRGLAYAEERMRAYIKRNEVGLATIKEVVDVQNDLVAAKVNQIQAQADYTIAIGQYWQATGELLDQEGITLNMKDADSLYEKSR